MRLPGWCTVCRKVKQVKVHTPRPGAMQYGICAACQAKAAT